jgi:uncharacterized protein
MVVWMLDRLIAAYQRLVSPFLPAGVCRFEPSCSHYAREALAVHGAIRGSAMAGWRLLRCQPFCKGGLDPVPPARALSPHREATP